MDLIILLMVAILFLGIVAGIYYDLDDTIKGFKKLFGPKYRIRKRKDGVSYVEKRYIFWYNHCDFSFHTDITGTVNWLKDELDGKHTLIPDEFIEIDISTSHTVSVKE